MRKTWRVTFKVKDPGVVVTEYLRYGGAISVYGGGHTGRVPMNVERVFGEMNDNQVFVTMYCPPGHAGEIWSDMNVKGLASFGVKAVAWKE